MTGGAANLAVSAATCALPAPPVFFLFLPSAFSPLVSFNFVFFLTLSFFLSPFSQLQCRTCHYNDAFFPPNPLVFAIPHPFLTSLPVPMQS